MEQGSEEWDDFRAIRITASRFGDVLANPKTKRYRYYMQDIVEALLGFPKFPKETPWFDHGKAWEAEARGMYAWETNTDLKDINRDVIVHPKYGFISISPDGVIRSKKIGLEIKCHKSAKQYLESKRKGIPSNHKPQVQGSLWVTGFERWDFVSYYKPKKLIHIHPVEPDLKYHERLESACLDFWENIQERVRKAA